MNVQIINCRCGKTFAAAVEPDCYTDRDWLRNLPKYINGGCTIKVVGPDEFTLEKCECNKRKKQPELF